MTVPFDTASDVPDDADNVSSSSRTPALSVDGAALRPRFFTAPPWHLADDGAAFECPVFWPEMSDDQWFPPGELDVLFTPAQNHRLSAVHEAGHLLLAVTFGVPIDGAELFTTANSAGGRDGNGGHAYLQDLRTPVTLGDAGALYVAGRMAEVLSLQKLGLLDDRRMVACDLHAAGDYAQLATMEGAEGRPVAVLFGPAQLPEGWTGLVLEIGTIAAKAGNILMDNWHLVTAVADHLEAHGAATAEQIHLLLRGHDPSTP